MYGDVATINKATQLQILKNLDMSKEISNTKQPCTIDIVSGCWFKQSEQDIMNVNIGSTLLIKFEENYNGITIDSGATVDISWMRSSTKDVIYATGGNYKKEDIREYMLIE